MLPDGAGPWSLVVHNLAANALRHSPEETTVTAALRDDGETVELSVTNEAPRIAAADLPRFTERLWRGPVANEVQAHSGLGLSIAAAAARRLGASLDFTLSDGRLTARLSMRRARPGAGGRARRSTTGGSSPTDGAR